MKGLSTMALKIIVDLILIGIILAGIYLGYKMGFTKIIARPVKLIASLAIAFSACAGFADAIIAPMISAPIQGYLANFMYENCANLTPDNLTEELPTLLKIAAAAFGIDIEAIASGAAITELLDTIIETLTTPVINVIAIVLSFVAVYLLARLGFSIAFFVIDTVFGGGLLGAVNKTLGVIFNTVFSIIIAWTLAVVLELIFNLPAFADSEFLMNYEGGIVYRFFNTYNPMELLLSF